MSLIKSILSFYSIAFMLNLDAQENSIIKENKPYRIFKIDTLYQIEYKDTTFDYTNKKVVCNVFCELAKYYNKHNKILPRYLKIIDFNKSSIQEGKEIDTKLKPCIGTLYFDIGIYDVKKELYCFKKMYKNKIKIKKIRIKNIFLNDCTR